MYFLTLSNDDNRGSYVGRTLSDSPCPIEQEMYYISKRYGGRVAGRALTPGGLPFAVLLFAKGGRSPLFRPPNRRNPRSSKRDDAETSLTAGAGRAFYHDLDVAAEQRQELHESLRGETRKLPAEQARDFWLVNFQYPGGVCLR